ncbi:hypothetical protein [Hymenobacter arcticus]
MEIVLEVPDKDVARVLELVKGIKRVKIKSPKPAPTVAGQQFLAELAGAIEEVNRHQRGEIELQSWDELYAELQTEQYPANNAGQLPEQSAA